MFLRSAADSESISEITAEWNCRSTRKRRLSKTHSIHRRNDEKGPAAVCSVSTQHNPHWEIHRKMIFCFFFDYLTANKMAACWFDWAEEQKGILHWRKSATASRGRDSMCLTSVVVSTKSSKAVERTVSSLTSKSNYKVTLWQQVDDF